MCVVSNIHDHYERVWPWEVQTPTEVSTGTVKIEWPQAKTALDLFEQIVDLTKQLDAILGLPDCESAHKTKWMKELKRQIREAEIAKINERLGR